MSVNRASEVWKEIKPFAIRDMNRMLDNKAGDSGDNLYAIILYDESAQKIKYYSMSAEGLAAALAAASSGDVVFVPAGTISNVYNSETIPCTTLNTKVYDLGLAGIPPEGWKELTFDDSGWATPVSIIFTGYDHSLVQVQPADVLWTADGNNTDQAVFRQIFYVPSTVSNVEITWDGDDLTPGIYINEHLVDSWDTWVDGDDHPARTVNVTNYIIPDQNNIIAVHQWNNRISQGAISWIITIEEGQNIIVPSGVELVGLGKNSVLDTSLENNGILTNIQVSGSISGTGILRMVPNPTAENFTNQIKSLVGTGTAPFSVESTTLVTNLNADMVDGLHASELVDEHEILSTAHTDSDDADTPVEGDHLAYRSSQWVAENGYDIGSDNADIIKVNFTEQVTAPDAPGSGHRLIYAKDDGIYGKDSSGTEVGPFGASGVEFNDSEGDPESVDYDAASDGVSVYAARRDHKHQLTVGSGEILIQDGSSAPPVMLTNEAEDDFLYEDWG